MKRSTKLARSGFGARAVVALLGVFGTLASSAMAAGPLDHQHTIWTDLLRNHVSWTRDGHHSVVDYSGLKADVRLNTYITSLSDVTTPDFHGWTRAQQLAFLLNAYNAYTVALVVGHYPKIDSIKDIGGWSSPWTYKFVPLFGEKVSLDHIEHELIRGDSGYGEPRIHFAVNCASVGCPALRPEAYTAAHLEEQLRDAEVRFLTDRKRNRVYPDRQYLQASPIFDWYSEDFGQGETGLKSYFAAHAELLAGDRAGRQLLLGQRFSIGFSEYDWSLNDLRTAE
jgi:hypothetical protein